MRIIVVAETDELNILSRDEINSADKIVVTGNGAINVITALEKYLPTAQLIDVVNVGYAGSPNIPVGETILVNHVETLHDKAKFVERDLNLKTTRKGLRQVNCFTSTDFVDGDSAPRKNGVYDMELAFIAALPWNSVTAIKKVSDNLNYDQYKEEVK